MKFGEKKKNRKKKKKTIIISTEARTHYWEVPLLLEILNISGVKVICAVITTARQSQRMPEIRAEIIMEDDAYVTSDLVWDTPYHCHKCIHIPA